VSFKLTHNQSEDVILTKIKNQLKDNKSDFVVHNELQNITLSSHEYSIWGAGSEKAAFTGMTKENMAKDIGGL
jgi:hypothetical protein